MSPLQIRYILLRIGKRVRTFNVNEIRFISLTIAILEVLLLDLKLERTAAPLQRLPKARHHGRRPEPQLPVHSPRRHLQQLHARQIVPHKHGL